MALHRGRTGTAEQRPILLQTSEDLELIRLLVLLGGEQLAAEAVRVAAAGIFIRIRVRPELVLCHGGT